MLQPPHLSNVQFLWQRPTAAQRFRTAVSLHGHTLHSKESLGFNHPLWDEKGSGLEKQWFALGKLLGQCGRYFYAFELNGLSPWEENRRVANLAAGLGYPVISGGDRHGREPNACVKLTNASTFDQFVSEVREGVSEVLFMPQYLQGYTYRILRNMADVLSDDLDHALGWRTWSERVFL